MDANTDGSGLARNQLFQNQNIHYQQTTGSGVGAHLVQRTKAWRQKITFMLFTREPIDILLLTVKYARPHYDVKMSGDIDLVRIIESKHWPRHPEQETYLRADNTNNRLPSEPQLTARG